MRPPEGVGNQEKGILFYDLPWIIGLFFSRGTYMGGWGNKATGATNAQLDDDTL